MLSTALSGTSTASARHDDITAWAALARMLGNAWTAAGTPAADLFARCSATAESGDLAAARATLTSGRAALPADFLRRTALRAAAAAALIDLTQAPPRDATGPQVTDGGASGTESADTEWAGTESADTESAGTEAACPDTTSREVTDVQATVRGRRGRASQPATGADELATVLGKRNRSPGSSPAPAPAGDGDRDILLRFGPGVPLGEQESLRALWPAAAPAPTARRRRRAGWLGAGAVMAAVAVVLWLLLRPTPGPVVTAAEVRAPTQRLSCGDTADLIGVMTTDGRGGPITYRWLRSDGQASGELTQTARRGDRTVTVHLRWTVRGPGVFRGTARLQVLRPASSPIEAESTFSYSCT